MQLPIVWQSPQIQCENSCPELSQNQQTKLYYLAFLPTGFSPLWNLFAFGLGGMCVLGSVCFLGFSVCFFFNGEREKREDLKRTLLNKITLF